LGSSFLTAQYLKAKHFDKKVFVLGTKGITQELDAVGIQSLHVGVSCQKVVFNYTSARNSLKTGNKESIMFCNSDWENLR